jgi:transcriptional regulator with XRE-family HTH domain
MPSFHNKELIQQLRDKEYREAYADDFLNAYIAAQIRAIREQRNMTQEELASLVGTQQAGISRVENVNYSGWNIRTLKKIAYALGARLHVSIETFGSLLEEGANFSRKALERPSVDDDPALEKEFIYLPAPKVENLNKMTMPSPSSVHSEQNRSIPRQTQLSALASNQKKEAA